jgi:hypothetical protein
MLAIPSQQTNISATQIAISNHLGIDLRTDGAKVAATIPAHRAIANCSPSGAPIAYKTRPAAQVLAALLSTANRHNRSPVRCSEWQGR